MSKILFRFWAGCALVLVAYSGISEAGKLANKPYRAFITLMKYRITQNSTPTNPISKIRLDFLFNDLNLQLPEHGTYWLIENGKELAINRTFEVSWADIHNDGFKFEIQIGHEGTRLDPCKFEVIQLSEFNRSYLCQVDMARQTSLNHEGQNFEGVEVRVFTDKNSRPKEIPTHPIALN